jgi:hypothetical protein
MSPSPPPEQVLQTCLADSSYRGTFESHLTIEAADLAQRQRFQEVCGQLGVKCVLIELPQGATRSQPMTACHHHGDIARVLGEVDSLCRRLRAAGFALVRVKLEAVAANEGVPDSDEEASRFPPENYFEFHVKLCLSENADREALGICCDRHAARLSRNALKTEEDGRTERFVTMRVYGAGRRSAFARLEALERDLSAAGFAIVNRQREYTLFDSAERLDAGWIDGPPQPGGGS